MPVVSARNLCHTYGARVILEGASLTVHRNERIGLVGDNGTGKSTLAKILVGRVQPDAGEVSWRKDSELAYLSQEVDFEGFEFGREYIEAGLRAWSTARQKHRELSEQIEANEQPPPALLEALAAADDDIERLGGWDQAHRIDEIAGYLRIASLDQPLAQMSGGERRRVALARVLVARPPFAVLDEPTNHLDIATIEWLENHLASDYTGALLLITHDRYFLDRLAQRTVELDAGSLHSYDGGWEAFLRGKAERLAHQARVEANRQNALRRELEWLRRSPKARTTKQQARVDRVEAMRDATPTAAPTQVAKLAFAPTRSGKTIAELRGLCVDVGGKRLVDSLDLVLKPGERIGIIGENGAGKTSLLRVLLGELEASGGSLKLGANTQMSYFDQERAELDDDATIFDNVVANQDVVTIGGRDINAKSYLARFAFVGDRQTQLLGTLSGGERARVAMAKFLLARANVLLLDEPTNDLDVTTLSTLEELLVETSATVLFVTHDRYFLDRVATAVLSFEGRGRVVRYEDRHQAAAGLELSTETSTRSSKPKRSKDISVEKLRPSPLTFTERHELEALMPEIERAEALVAALDEKLADPDLYAKRGEQVPALREQRKAAQNALDVLMERWEELEGKM